MFDAIIIGSGAAGAMAAWALRGRNVLVLDVGYRAEGSPAIEGSLYEARRREADLFALLIGERFQALRNLYQPAVSLKLKAPLTEFVIRDAERLSPVRGAGFQAVMSFAAGGLANAWGAGVFRFKRRDLEGFPITEADLEPFYNEAAAHIGVSGANDDLAPWFGEERCLQPPIEMSRLAAGLLSGYRRRREEFIRSGIAMGRPRLAVLTKPHRNREPYRYGNLEFFRLSDPAIYNPVFTLDELVAANQVTWERGQLAVRYSERNDGVEVISRKLATGAAERFHGRTLILAAGALNSAKLVLRSNDDYETRLPVMDNPMACLPLFRLGLLGEALDARDSSLAQLSLVRDDGGALRQGSIYGSAGPLRSDILFQLPLSITANLSFLRRLEAATGLVMMFSPCDPHPANFLRLCPDNAVEIQWGQPAQSVADPGLVKAFRRMGCFASGAMWQYPPMGAGIHYAGCLPMRVEPGLYEVDAWGKLSGTRRVYVVDGAVFPRLPAKNLTFTIMANAMRIASHIPFEAL